MSAIKPGFGWVTVNSAGVMDVRTLSETHRAVMVNWLVTRGTMIWASHTDEEIERMFYAKSNDVIVAVDIIARQT